MRIRDIMKAKNKTEEIVVKQNGIVGKHQFNGNFYIKPKKKDKKA